MQKLQRLEQVIDRGLEEFYRVGTALTQIKEERLYQPEYPDFSTYCRKRWGISLSMSYHLMSASNVVDSLTVDTLPAKSSHASKLHIVKDSELRNEAWSAIVETNLPITGKLVSNYAHKYFLIENDPGIADAVKRGQITPEHGYNLYKTLKRLPPYYRTAGFPHGDTLRAIRHLELAFKDEALDILRSGYLGDTPLERLTERDVNLHLRHLYWESKQQVRLEAGIKQAAKADITILSGLEIPEKLVELKDQQQMIYLFPEGVYDTATLGKLLDKHGFGVFYFAAYTKNQPTINFDGTNVLPSEVVGPKPDSLIKGFRQLSAI